MLKRAVSGQFLFFDLVSALSGNPVTGASGQISGRKATDAISGMILLSGNIIELGGGAYRANLFDWDCSGLFLGYLFTSSGCVPRMFSVVTVDATSGSVFPASGINATVPIASISGAVANSGLNVTVPIATISGVIANSGLNVTVPIATISGVIANSGLNVTVPIATISGVVANSGLFTVATLLSGTAFLASGSIFRTTYASGVLGASGGHTLAWGDSGQAWSASGANAVVPVASLSGVIANSGLNVTVPIATISGLTANSGLFVNVPIASISGAIVNSGLFVTVPSGSLYLASGPIYPADVQRWVGVAPNALVSSGRVDAAFNVRTGVARSGTSTTIQLDAGVPTGISGTYDNQVVTIVAGTGAGRSRAIQNMGSSGIAFVFPAWDSSGVPDTTSVFTLTPGALTFSGLVNPASGANVVVPITSLSGVVANSGLNVTVPIATISGVVANSGLNVTVPIATLSGVVVNSGLNVTVPIATISGAIGASGLFVTADLLSGRSVLPYSGQLSGQLVSPASGVGAPLSGLTFIASGPNVVGTFSLGSGALSGQKIELFSGNVVSLLSGQQVQVWSGTYVNVFSGSLSGQPLTLLSGYSYPASGVNVVVPPATLSGAVVNSGLFVTVPIASISGAIANSGLFVTAALSSGQSVLVSSGQLSGQNVTAITVSDKSGYILANSGLDLIVVESGMQFRQAQAVIAAAAAGRLSGAGTTTVRIDGANASGVLRINAQVNASGDRTAVTLTLP